jgi:hypothetical protein
MGAGNRDRLEKEMASSQLAKAQKYAHELVENGYVRSGPPTRLEISKTDMKSYLDRVL